VSWLPDGEKSLMIYLPSRHNTVVDRRIDGQTERQTSFHRLRFYTEHRMGKMVAFQLIMKRNASADYAVEAIKMPPNCNS